MAGNAMRRRAFIVALMSTAALAGHGRAELRSRARRIAIVHLSHDDNSVSENGSPEWRAFFSELHQRGYAEGHNLIVDRYAVKPSSFVDTGPDAAVAIVSREPEVIVVTSGGWARRIRIATTHIPIVAMTADPI